MAEIAQKKRRFNNREKSMFIVLALLIALLIGKSLFFGEVKNLTSDEVIFKTFVDYTLEEEFNGVLVDSGIIQYKIFDIFLAAPNEESLLRYQDPITGQMIEKTLKGRYTARVRKVLLWVFPLKEISITSKIVGK